MMTSRLFRALADKMRKAAGLPPRESEPFTVLAEKLYGPRRTRARCAGEYDYGPWKGQRCNETNPRRLIRCDTALDPGCEKYFCLLLHWHDHWDEHETVGS